MAQLLNIDQMLIIIIKYCNETAQGVQYNHLVEIQSAINKRI